MQASDSAFEGTVTGVNKGGAIVLVEGLRAFLPGSHLSGIFADDSLVGQKLRLKFLEVRCPCLPLINHVSTHPPSLLRLSGGLSVSFGADVCVDRVTQLNRESGKVVVSHRRAMVDSQMESMSRGDVVSGVVKLLKPYGAFVEVNGMSGLLHISQVSYDRVEDLSLVLQPGMGIKCMIVDHDKVGGCSGCTRVHKAFCIPLLLLLFFPSGWC
jgi:small subunit ribosomal protein S1